MGREATLYLLERGVRVTGTDGWSWDAPFIYTDAEIRRDAAMPSLIWEGHRAGREIGYCHIEKLHNLEALPVDGLHGELLSGESARRLGRMDARGGDHRRLITPRSGDSIARQTTTDLAQGGAPPARVLHKGECHGSTPFRRRLGCRRRCARRPPALCRRRLSDARDHLHQSVSARRRRRRGRRVRSPRRWSRSSSSRA